MFLLKKWLRGLDSNQDNQLQRLACYQLHYPGIVLCKGLTYFSSVLPAAFSISSQ
jgi:hypothetical protein